jgi:acyl-homoserine lactone acylase PvdQ
MDDMGIFEQMYAMVVAKDCDEFYKALAMDHLMEQNVMFGDRKGNIGYVRTGRTPKRPEGYDWSAPVPGWISKTEWHEMLPMDDHVRIMNPPQGYMQNCNISPENMMENSPLTPDKYPKEVYNVSWDFNNPRGKRMLKLLSEHKMISKEDAKAFVMDITCNVTDNWVAELVRAVKERDTKYMNDANFADAFVTTMSWRSDYDKDLRAPVFMWKLRTHAQGNIDSDKISKGGKLTQEEQDKLIELFKEAVDEVAAKWDVHNTTLGDIFKVGRDGQYFPCSGGDFGSGESKTQTVRNTEFKEDP